MEEDPRGKWRQMSVDTDQSLAHDSNKERDEVYNSQPRSPHSPGNADLNRNA